MFPEKSVDFQRVTQHYIPESITLHNHHYENLKQYKDRLFCLCNTDGIVKSLVSCPCVNLLVCPFFPHVSFLWYVKA
jgi:hypothetical protein